MLKSVLKNAVISILTIYSLNIILVKFGFIVPINYFSIFFTSVLGIPGVIVYAILSINFL